MEKVLERERGPEPLETVYDQLRGIDNVHIKHRREGKVVLKGKDFPWNQSRQGFSKWFSYEGNWDQLGVSGWRIFINLIKSHGGKHRHQGGLAIYVLSGRGYTVVDGTKYEWEEGDLLLLPVKPEGCEHQHFNEDPEKPAQWMAFIFIPFRDPVGVEFLQKEDHPDWTGRSK